MSTTGYIHCCHLWLLTPALNFRVGNPSWGDNPDETVIGNLLIPTSELIWNSPIIQNLYKTDQYAAVRLHSDCIILNETLKTELNAHKCASFCVVLKMPTPVGQLDLKLWIESDALGLWDSCQHYWSGVTDGFCAVWVNLYYTPVFLSAFWTVYPVMSVLPLSLGGVHSRAALKPQASTSFILAGGPGRSDETHYCKYHGITIIMRKPSI